MSSPTLKPDERTFTRREAADRYRERGIRRGRSYSKLSKLASAGEGPEFFVIAGMAYYTDSAIEADIADLLATARRG